MSEHIFHLSDMRAAMKRIEEGGHSVFSPSGSKTWLNCAGALIPGIFAPDDSGPEAAYGTVAHSIAEEWLKTGIRPQHHVGTWRWIDAADWGFKVDIDDEMLDYVAEYIDRCEWLPGDHFVETKVYFSQLTPIPNQGGTADHVACSPGLMTITDLKMGKGVHVYAEKNTQALLYALGFFYEWDHKYHFQKFVIRINQPRRDNFDEWIVDRAYLLKFAEKVKKRAAAAWKQNAPRTPSKDACQWCRVKSTCTALAKSMIDMTEGAFDDLLEPVTRSDMVEFKATMETRDAPVMPDPAVLSTADLARLYGFRGTIEKFFSAVEGELFKRANGREHVPGYKLVEGRAFRTFSNPKLAGERLIERFGLNRDDVFVTEVASPAQMEVLLRKNGIKGKKALEAALDGLIFRPPGKPTLAPDQDRRTAISDVSGDAFSDLIE